MSYDWRDHYTQRDGDGSLIPKDGWYLIKLETARFNDRLAPNRCVLIKDGKWLGSYIGFADIESPAFTIDKKYEFSLDGVRWFVDTFTGYEFDRENTYHTKFSVSKYCREIQPKKDTIKLMINDKEVTLSEESIKAIKDVL